SSERGPRWFEGDAPLTLERARAVACWPLTYAGATNALTMSINAHRPAADDDALARREAFVEIVAQRQGASQAKLCALLRQRGTRATQATLSRDLRTLGIRDRGKHRERCRGQACNPVVGLVGPSHPSSVAVCCDASYGILEFTFQPRSTPVVWP